MSFNLYAWADFSIQFFDWGCIIRCVNRLLLFQRKIEAGPDKNSADLNYMERKVQMLERKLKKEEKERIRLKAIRSREALHRTEMEDFFMQCIEVCNRGILGTKPVSSAIYRKIQFFSSKTVKCHNFCLNVMLRCSDKSHRSFRRMYEKKSKAGNCRPGCRRSGLPDYERLNQGK